MCEILQWNADGSSVRRTEYMIVWGSIFVISLQSETFLSSGCQSAILGDHMVTLELENHVLCRGDRQAPCPLHP